jgi:hypothetical protein
MHDQQRSNRGSRSGSSRPRRGGRGGRSSSNSNSQRSSYSATPRPQPAPVKLSFWQKLVGIFTGKSKKATAPSATSRQSSASNGTSSAGSAGRPADSHRRFESAPAAASTNTPRQTRKPELVEVNSPKIYVGNLSFDATESDLQDLFNGVGQVQNAEVVSNKYTQKSKGFAFVTMLTVDEARRAVTELHDKEFMGRKLVVSGAKTTDMRDGYRPSESAPAPESAPASEPAQAAEPEAEASAPAESSI